MIDLICFDVVVDIEFGLFVFSVLFMVDCMVDCIVDFVVWFDVVECIIIDGDVDFLLFEDFVVIECWVIEFELVVELFIDCFDEMDVVM